MGEYLSEHHGIFDTGDDATAALAFGAGQNVDAEDAAHEFGPEQVSVSTFAAIVGGFVTHVHCQGVGLLADDFGSESGGGGEDVRWRPRFRQRAGQLAAISRAMAGVPSGHNSG